MPQSNDTLPAANPGKPRSPLSKKLRFEVFKRDNFTCQYCGAQPPKVVLEVDHIHPIAEGGSSEPENLITSCNLCNRGKGKRVLGDKIIRPDADLMWLQTQQELAELKRYQKVKAQREKATVEIVGQLQQHWMDVTGLDWSPSDAHCRQLINRHSPEVVEQAFTIVGPKVKSGYLRYADEWKPYLAAVCRNMANDVIPESREVVNLREELNRAQDKERTLSAFLGLVLSEECYSQAEPFPFDQQQYASMHQGLVNGRHRLRWVSTDEGQTWALWIDEGTDG